MSTDTTFLQRLETGRFFEKIVEKWLVDHLYHVIPTYAIGADITGHASRAPAMISADGMTILPDMIASRDGITRFVEVKNYARAGYNRRHACMTHGIPRRYIDAYRHIQIMTGIPVIIVIIESPDGLRGTALWSPLDTICENIMPCMCMGCSHGTLCTASDHMLAQHYWRRDIMTIFGQISGGKICKNHKK